MQHRTILRKYPIRRAFRTLFSIILLLALPALSSAQHNQKYYPSTDSLVQKNLKQWGDQKFGLLMHWGPYCQWSVVESWSLCPEDESWCKRTGPYSKDYFQYRQAYEKLQTTFNPLKFDPSKWAKAAKEAGMRYVVFTTKHHDGFCMFDTKETQYKITDPSCPFSSNPRADVTKAIFNAFRTEGMLVGAYFSKPDWHCPDYWDPYFPPSDRNPNYDLTKYPEKWERYKTFTYNQIRELMQNYGKIDILWLDGGWVQPMTATSPRWGKTPMHQDIDMARIAAMARSYQPGLIIVDRAVEGPYQNYLTPEQSLPDSILPYPWETCMTMATSWSYVENDQYKSTNELIHLLCKIVSRGGNFLLNVAPGPDGDFAPEAYNRLKEIGEWMKINGEAIYGSSPVSVRQTENLVYTGGKNNELYVILLAEKDAVMPGVVNCIDPGIHAGCTINMLGSQTSLKWNNTGENVKILIPEKLRKSLPCKHAWVFKITG